MIKSLIAWLNGFRYLPHARKQWSECGAIVVVGGPPWSLAQRGVETDETGINIAAFGVRYYLAVNEKLPSNVGEPRARAQSDGFSRDITVRGETLGSGTGVMAFTMATDCSLANDINTFGDGAGVVLLDEVTENQERSGWRAIDMRLSSDPQLIAI